MKETSVLERNLLALSVNDPEFCGFISAVKPSPYIDFIPTAKDLLVPALIRPRSGAGRRVSFHSTVDPEKEGRRFLDIFSKAGYLVFLGLGGGYHIRPFLEQKDVSRLLLIDKDPGLFRAVIERIDLRSIFLDSRVRIILDRELNWLKDFLLADYFPAIDGDLKTIPLRTAFDAQREYFQDVMITIKKVIGKIADDYTVQAQFGKKWFINTLANLSRAEISTLTVRPVRRAIITGAGPSLEIQIKCLPELRKQALLIASDTSLPALLGHGIKPDLVISIDCQQISYHHFLQGIPEDIPLVLDLASPPVLTRITDKIIFFSSGHPFSQYLTSKWRRFPYIDTSGGNVSHAAISLAQYLGAREITLLGIDFSFPEGKSYSRGTYMYPLFRSAESRVNPLETLFFSFILKNSTIIKERVDGCIRYTTKPMISYKERLEVFLQKSKAAIIPLPGKGVPLNIDRRLKEEKQGSGGHILSAGAPKTDWKYFLKAYLTGLRALPEPYHPLSGYFRMLSKEEQSLWITQFPAATAIRESLGLKTVEGPELLKQVREWASVIILRALDR